MNKERLFVRFYKKVWSYLDSLTPEEVAMWVIFWMYFVFSAIGLSYIAMHLHC